MKICVECMTVVELPDNISEEEIESMLEERAKKDKLGEVICWDYEQDYYKSML